MNEKPTLMPNEPREAATRRKFESIETWVLRIMLGALLLAGVFTLFIIGAPLRTLWLAIPAVVVYLLLRRSPQPRNE